MAKSFLPYSLDQQILLPQDMREWLPENHLANFILDLVDTLDLDAILAVYRAKDGRGRAAYHPKMMVSLLVYAYCMGKPSSRKIERATYEDVAYRVIAGDQHPDHDTISDFRRQHLKALSGLFVQVLLLCQQAGLVKLGHVSVDGTKVKANASKHKAMGYKRMCETEARLEKEVEALLQEAQQVDDDEDAKYGKGRRADEIPGDLARRESRLKKLKEAKAALEKMAKDKAAAKAKEQRTKLAERKRKEQETGKKTSGRPPQVPDPDEAVPDPKSQRNFTDPESRIMKDGASKSFEQAYNAQAAVDAEAQVIVASSVTQEANDKKQLVPMLKKTEKQTGRMPEKASADSGYFSDSAVSDGRVRDVDLYVPPERQKRGSAADEPADPVSTGATQAGVMREKLKSPEGRKVYAQRKHVVEPVFGQIKEVRGFRRFSFRGFEKVSAEWDLICLTHNLLKLFRSGFSLQAA
jgi:transposase